MTATASATATRVSAWPACARRIMTPARVRLAVIGAGAFGRKHVDTVMRETACELVAIADPLPAVAAYASGRGICSGP
jgi:predicted homoserine dehydrogenase-like protein